jgi:hypothetical protein
MKNPSLVPLLARKSRWVLPLIVATAILAACGNLTGGGLGEATVVVSGDHEPPTPSPANAAPETPVLIGTRPNGAVMAAAPALADEVEEPEGEVEIDMQLYMVDDLGQRVKLGGDEIRVKVDLQGVVAEEAARSFVAAVHYAELRVIFTKIQAEVEAGLVVGGVPVVGEVHVEMEDIELEVVRAIDVDLQEGGAVEMVLDLNAPAWLAAVDPVTRTVDATVFASLVGVVTP